MSVVSARSEWSTIIAKVKLSLGLRQSIHIEPICIVIVCQIIGGKKVDGRRVTRFNTNFQQALDYFKWCKAANRISVRCHVASAFLFKNPTHGPIFCSPCFFQSDNFDVRKWKVVCSSECKYSHCFSPAFLTPEHGEKFQKRK